MTRDQFNTAFLAAIDRQEFMVAHTPGWKPLIDLVWEELSARPEARFGAWILTSERLPEGNDTVLGSGPSATVEGRYWRDTMSADFVRRNSSFVTHWMPMPDKPSPQQERK